MGSSNKAQREATRAEEQRSALVADTQRRIEGIFSAPGREAGVLDVENATRDFLQGDLDRQNDSAARNLKFSNARAGQTGGSVAIDQNRQRAEDFLRGSVEVQRRAGAAGNALRQADQQSKLGLFSMAQQGLDMTTAVRQAGESLRNNIAGVRADATESGLGNLFAKFGDINKASREAAGERAARKHDFGGSLFSTAGGTGNAFGGGP